MRDAVARPEPPPSAPWWPGPIEPVAYAVLPATPATASWARRHARAILGAWQIPADTIETAALLTTELSTNANAATTATARPAPGTAQPIISTLRHQPGQIVIEISDADPSLPVLEDAGPDAENGRGLMLVQALSKEWSCYLLPSGGKTAYCAISVTNPSAGSTDPGTAPARDAEAPWVA